jgi:cell wall assembly regulator SMI1
MRDWYATNAPAVYATLREPASADQLAQAQQAMGQDLPVDLLAWWELADGVKDEAATAGSVVPPFYNPYPVASALDSRQDWLATWPGDDGTAGLAGTERTFMWLPSWLPIANNGGGNDLFIDLRPGPLHGCVMEFDRVDGAGGPPLWPNIETMLTAIADALETRSAIDPFGDGPMRVELLDGGRLDWADAPNP